MKLLPSLSQLHMHVNSFKTFPTDLPRGLRVLVLEQNKIRGIKRNALITEFQMIPIFYVIYLFELFKLNVNRWTRGLGSGGMILIADRTYLF